MAREGKKARLDPRARGTSHRGQGVRPPKNTSAQIAQDSTGVTRCPWVHVPGQRERRRERKCSSSAPRRRSLTKRRARGDGAGLATGCKESVCTQKLCIMIVLPGRHSGQSGGARGRTSACSKGVLDTCSSSRRKGCNDAYYGPAHATQSLAQLLLRASCTASLL